MMTTPNHNGGHRLVLSTLRRSFFLVLAGCFACPSLLSAAEIRFSATATGAATWRDNTAWTGGAAPTADDDVIFDFANTPAITSMALHTSPDDFYAKSLTFGSANGPALGAFEFRNGNTGAANRNLLLTTGAITVASQVTGTQTMRSSQGKTTLLAVDHSFEVTNNSTQQFIINSIFADNGTAASLNLSTTATGGSIALGGINTHTGGTNISANSSVIIQNQLSLRTGAVAVGSGATLDLAVNTDVTFAGLNDVSGSGGTVTRTNTNKSRILILDGTGSYAFSGTLTTSGSGAIDTHFALQLTGGGTQKLSGANTYGGTTTVTNGTLLANNTTGSATGTGNVFVGADGVLGGTGFISSAFSSAATATFSAGDDGVGTFTVNNNFNLQSGAVFNFELGTVSDKIVVGGQLRGSTVAGGLVFNFSNAGGLTTGTAYTLFDYTGGSLNNLDISDFALSTSSIAAGFVLDANFGNGGWLINTANQLVQVQFSAIPTSQIPEPSTLGFIAGLAVFVIGTGARKNHRKP